eukprot:scaffold115108_cov28-Tisochrysis_lutea.AAC.5
MAGQINLKSTSDTHLNEGPKEDIDVELDLVSNLFAVRRKPRGHFSRRNTVEKIRLLTQERVEELQAQTYAVPEREHMATKRNRGQEPRERCAIGPPR